MTSQPWRFWIALALLGFATILPAPAGAQCPVYSTQWGSVGSANGKFSYPYGVATDIAGNVYVADTGNHRILKFTSTGVYLSQWGSFGSGDAQFNSTFGVATDATSDVYIADYGNHRIQKFTLGAVTTIVTTWGRLKSTYR